MDCRLRSIDCPILCLMAEAPPPYDAVMADGVEMARYRCPVCKSDNYFPPIANTHFYQCGGCGSHVPARQLLAAQLPRTEGKSCECGSTMAGSPKHSPWCKAYEP